MYISIMSIQIRSKYHYIHHNIIISQDILQYKNCFVFVLIRLKYNTTYKNVILSYQIIKLKINLKLMVNLESLLIQMLYHINIIISRKRKTI